MPKTAKIAVSLPEDLLRGIDGCRAASGETRSGFIRRAVEAFFRRERERQAEEQYIRGYLRHPETAEEVAEVEAMYLASLEVHAEVPWDDGDVK